jgi:multidrug transporter EmrE-like cation transporter
MKTPFCYSYIILAVVFQSMSGIFGKYAALSLSSFSISLIITNGFYLLSLACLFLQAVVWQQALRHFPLSFAYPFMGVVNFVVLFFSAILFQEGVTPANIIGLVLISTGIAVLSHGMGEGA